MSQVIPISARTLANGLTQLPDANLPVGTTGAQLVIDGTSWNPAMTLLVQAVVLDAGGAQVFGAFNNVGPGSLGINKRTGLPNTVIDMNFGWGPTASAAGWKIRSSYTLTNGPLPITGGTLTILP